MPRVLAPADAAIDAAVSRWRGGGVVAFPTETVYGLGADTFNVDALRQVYELKGRPPSNPLIAHVSTIEQARDIASQWDDRCELLAQSFWPGPLTMVVSKSSRVPKQATANLLTIAIRSPSHPVARRLLERFGSAISAPSANRSGHVSPTRAEHVAMDFADVEDLLIIDGGASEIGIESTVIDLSQPTPRILRPGTITHSQLHAVIGEMEAREMTEQGAAPGTSLQHYAPSTSAELVPSARLAHRLNQVKSRCAVLCFEGTRVDAPHAAIVMPDDPVRYAQRLYHALREADAMRAERIFIEEPPMSDAEHQEAWRAVRDRLKRATA